MRPQAPSGSVPATSHPRASPRPSIRTGPGSGLNLGWHELLQLLDQLGLAEGPGSQLPGTGGACRWRRTGPADPLDDQSANNRTAMSDTPNGAPHAASSGTKRKVIIDTDAGVDDAVAILSILRSDNCDLQAITTVDGNAALAQCTANVRTLLAIDRERYGHIPIYPGAAGPLIQQEDYFKELWDGMGSDGFGGCRHLYEAELADEIAQVQVMDEHAASALVRLAKANPGITLIALGPLTNVAMAIRLDPQFLTYVDQVFIMGGTILGKGNANRTAEFNFYCDPEAAHVVFTSSTKHSTADHQKLVLSPWELTMETAFEWTQLDAIIAHAQTNVWAKFLQRITSTLSKLYRAQSTVSAGPSDMIAQLAAPPRHDIYAPQVRAGGQAYMLLCDTAATFPVTIPEAVTRSFTCHAEIELAGRHSRGMLCLEWYPFVDVTKQKYPANVEIITNMNLDLLVQEMNRIFEKQD
ncbi:hypothetical protein AMAG_10680 [Allomyces macrogynus ATCC 38327]|uniref:Inosine/uridine-preferring nucleoside hydrolase domain-containing protein n=1 Tax=Allomyces macrogynus (strain ATCC 38327) TaxID=578462 RepID=A0A0L0SRP0_ALLM3|nr:hypothetical protein AMAG_10680 [Allomyces macrogynus ATCC 38327]|eukprot:KNE65014.1 hypothetical protein AMAG_10680 [Allomyces macrogynus ATCC 38327]